MRAGEEQGNREGGADRSRWWIWQSRSQTHKRSRDLWYLGQHMASRWERGEIHYGYSKAKGFISCIDDWIWQYVNGKKIAAWKSTIKLLYSQIVNILNTIRNEPFWPLYDPTFEIPIIAKITINGLPWIWVLCLFQDVLYLGDLCHQRSLNMRIPSYSSEANHQ